MGMGLLLLLFCFMSGCTQVISDRNTSSQEPEVTFTGLQTEPEQYIGRKILLGGIIVEVENGDNGGNLKIVQTKLGEDGTPGPVDESEGRFLATTGSFLDPQVYQPGMPVTMVGVITGSRTLPIDQMEYLYPELRVEELYLWSEKETESIITPEEKPYHWGHDTPPYWLYRPTGPPWRLW
jgi:outer membrane lipoprotein